MIPVGIGAARHGWRQVVRIDKLTIAGLTIAGLTFAGLALAGLTLALATTAVFGGEAPALQLTNAWVPVSAKIGGDVALLMTIKNASPDADNLLRIDCPIANFAEKHIVDRGEGAPAMRAVKSIPIAASGETALKADGYHVMLLQTRQILAEGDRFSCSVVFQKAGRIETEVDVARPR